MPPRKPPTRKPAGKTSRPKAFGGRPGAKSSPKPFRGGPSAGKAGSKPFRSAPSTGKAGSKPFRGGPSAGKASPKPFRDAPSAAKAGPRSFRDAPSAANAGPKPFRRSPTGKPAHGKGFRGKRADKAVQIEALRGVRAGRASHLKDLRGKPLTRTAFHPDAAPAPTSFGPDTGRLAALMSVEAGLEKKAERPTLLDVRGISSYADYVVVMSADNRRQIEAVAQEIEHRLRGAGIRPLGTEGNGDTGWLLLDFADVVVHLFTPEAREFYDIEGLWADAPRLKTAV